MIISVWQEKLHRYVFDTYYRQDYAIRGTDYLVIWVYNLLCRVNPNWRYALRSQCKRYRRYSDHNRKFK